MINYYEIELQVEIDRLRTGLEEEKRHHRHDLTVLSECVAKRLALSATNAELLAALKGSRELLRWWQGERGDDIHYAVRGSAIHAAIMEKNDAAIAKAEQVKS